MKISITSTAVLAVLGVAQFHAGAQGHGSTRDGVYTETQAGRGQESYKKKCASCHGEALQGKGATTPALAGEDFRMKWAGQTLDDLFEQIQTSMPANHPGTLARTENADILAYLLKANGLVAGKAELSSDAEVLKQIQFEAAK